jgi:hypothetical protein
VEDRVTQCLTLCGVWAGRAPLLPRSSTATGRLLTTAHASIASTWPIKRPESNGHLVSEKQSLRWCVIKLIVLRRVCEPGCRPSSKPSPDMQQETKTPFAKTPVCWMPARGGAGVNLTEWSARPQGRRAPETARMIHLESAGRPGSSDYCPSSQHATLL